MLRSTTGLDLLDALDLVDERTLTRMLSRAGLRDAGMLQDPGEFVRAQRLLTCPSLVLTRCTGTSARWC
jgi:hypothetical protein